MKKFLAISFAMMCMTLTSFAGDLLTAAMFHNWSSSGAGAVDNGATGCNYKINDQSASDGLPYGDGNVYYLNYADLTAYSTMEIEFTEGTPRLLFNRLVDQGTVGVEINGNAGMDYVEATEGKWVVDLAAITEAQGFAHLHCIKGANWANATVTRVELFKDEPAPAPTFGVESFVGYSYEGLDNAVSDEFTATMVETLGLTGADGETIEIGAIMPDGTVDWTGNGKGETDGWRDAEGNWCAWNTAGFTFFSQPYVEYADGQWYFGTAMGSAPGAVTEPTSFETAFVFKANGKECTVTFTLNYVERPELNVEVQEEVDVPAFLYDFTLGYAGGSAKYDTSMVKDAIGCSVEEAEVFGFNPSTEEAVRDAMATYDGWHAANGDLLNWGEAPFCIKFYNDGTFWYCSMPDVAELGATYKTSWLLVNPNTGDAVQYNFTMTDDVAARKIAPNDQPLATDLYKDYATNPEGDAFETALTLNAATRTVFGNKSIFAERYADLSDWNYMTIVFDTNKAPGTPQLIFNRQGTEDQSPEYLEINSAESEYVSYSQVDGTVNFWIIDLAKISEAEGFAHLNIIRGDKFVETYVTRAKLYNNNPAPGRFEDADYYLYNEEADAWLVGANSWGTQASFGKHGMPVKFNYSYGDYTIDTYTFNSDVQHYLGPTDPTFYVDANAAEWAITELDGSYYFSVNGLFMANDGTSVIARATERTDAGKWQLFTKAELEAKMLDPEDPFVDATFYAQVPNFSRNQAYTTRGQSPWTREAANCNLSGGDNTNNNAESWRSSNGFNVYQTLTNLPTGVYKIDVQGAVCEYANPKNGQDLAVAYANYATTPFVVSALADRQAGNENSMSEMSASFSAGKYQLEPMFVAVTDGTLTIGVKSPRTDTWAVWDNFELTYVGDDFIQEGEYYLYNAEADAWFGGGNSWGTQASLIKHGMPVYVGHESGNVYYIDTYTYNSAAQHFLGSNLYVDADKTNWSVQKVGEGENDWAFCVDGNYIGYDGNSDILVSLTDKDAPGARWTLVTRAEREATLAEATLDNPVDATFYIEVPNFSRNQAFTAQGQSPWTVVANNKNLSGGNNINNCAESWRSSNGFNVYQTLTNMPNGVYKLYAQAAVCDYAGTFEDLAYVYANEKKREFNSSSRWTEGVQENGENSMSAMSESFSAGKYAIKPILVLVTDGQIELGVNSPRTDTWAVWDNFELYYLGADIDTLHVGPFYKMVASDNVVIEYHEGAAQAGQGINVANYLTALHATSVDEVELFAVDTSAGLTFEPYSWVNFTSYYDAEGSVSGIANAAVKANVDLAGNMLSVESLEETVDPRYHAYAVVACPTTSKAILVDIEVNFVDRPDYVATAIETVKSNDADAQIFDLAGREVKKATKGVYIINGVKTLVK